METFVDMWVIDDFYSDWFVFLIFIQSVILVYI